MNISSLFRIAALLALTTPSTSGLGEQISGADRAFFENRIRPVLVKHCYQCHSTDAKEIGGKLYLDSKAGISKGGQSGGALVPHHPDRSLIMDALRHDGIEMPPETPLPPSVVKDFETWIRRGAADPRVTDAKPDEQTQYDSKSLWSFVAPSDVKIPEVADRDWPQESLDHFVLAAIERTGLRPTRDSDPGTLIRRLYIDLIGLPPSVEAIEDFKSKYERNRPVATEQLVDSLLNRPQFGQRWARHWLDVARFGESNGNDGLGRNASFPHAWRYRDYVIDCFNDDVPYDRFVMEQVAGDLLPATTAAQRNRQLVATGFLAVGPKPAAAMNKNFAMDVVDDQINVISTGLMGLSVSCARCHDHKHDPIPTRDYYAMAGIFSSTETLYGLAGNEKLTAPPTELHALKSTLHSSQNRKQTPRFPHSYVADIGKLGPLWHDTLASESKRLTADAVTFNPDHFAQTKTARMTAKLEKPTQSYSVSLWFKNDVPNNKRPITAYLFSRAKMDAKELPGDHIGIGGKHDAARTGKLFIFNGNGKDKKSVAGSTVIPVGTWNHVTLVRNENRVRLFLNGALEIETELIATFGDSPDFCFASRSDKFAPLEGNLAHITMFDRALSDEQAIGIHELSGQPRGARTLGFAMGVRDKTKPADCKIHVGGETAKLGAEVARGFLSDYERFVSQKSNAKEPKFLINDQQSGRLQLARWIVDPSHPQTARVMVNRVWTHLFGQGIVATPDDFGVYGARPTNQPLLDHLANRFVADGWSVKQLIRAIVLSRTYQLDSNADPSLIAADPDNELLARHLRRRLDAESLRDSILLATGQLNLSPGHGSAIESVDALINWPPGESSNYHRDSNHRSIFLCMLRHAPPPELAAFDLPDGMSVTGRRSESTLPTQSLFLINSPFVVRQSEALASTLMTLPISDSQRIQLAFHRILNRDPNEQETEQSIRHLASVQSSIDQQVAETEIGRLKSWASLCQALLSTNEFRYID